MSVIVSLQVTIFALIALGFVLRRTGVVKEQGQKELTDVVIYAVLPCNILNAFLTGADRGRLSSYVLTVLIAAGIQAVCYAYAKLAFRSAPDGQRECLSYGTLCSNAGFIGNPIVEGLYGEEGLALGSVFLIPLRIVMWSAGIAMFSNEKDGRKVLRRVATHPCILACVLGIALMLADAKLPEIVLSPIRAVGRCNTALSMMVVGMILEKASVRSFTDRRVLLFCLHRLVLIPALVYALLAFLPIDRTVVRVCVILTAMPAGATTGILAGKYGKEPGFATRLVVVSTLLSLPTVCLWSALLNG